MHEHLASLRRQHPARLRVASVGFLPEKRDWLDRRFDCYAFSFVLAGDGEYVVGGRSWPVQAPCVLTQRAGEHFRYGPHGTWEEVYVTYPIDAGDELRRLGFIAPERPLWSLGDPTRVLAQVADLAALLREIATPGAADRLDRLAEQMVLTSLLDAAAPAATPALRAVQELRAWLAERCLQAHDVDALARARGLAPATFRRLWNRLVGVPPGRWLMQLRLQRACRMLVEGDEPVAAIAQRVGFADPLHFSRRFRAVIGETATAHRARHRPRRRPAATPGPDRVGPLQRSG